MAPSKFSANNIKTIKHSAMVANAARMIALRTNGIIDSDMAYMCGIFHDIGKLDLDESEKYKHPLIGYQMMIENGDKTIAEVCISHPFVTPYRTNYLECYCGNDTETLEIILDVLSTLTITPLIRLIQFCDKISGVDKYMSIEDKFEWYRNKYNTTSNLIETNFDAYMEIKKEIEEYIKDDVYKIVFN
ncbi:MAG: HDIG domain-containing protein [Holosporales bacterium]|jgi:putative nucleotidyltransferase with HDIG domain|nr:HDIG domain-containing protein [Holosporales bacterium]